MKQFWTVLRFEFGGYLKSKAFVGITVAAVLIIGVLLFYPRLAEIFSAGKEQREQERGEIALRNGSGIPDEALLAALGAGLTDKDIVPVKDDQKALRTAVERDDYDGALVLESPLQYVYIVQTVSINDATTGIVDETLLQMHRQSALVERGVPPGEAQEIINAPVQGRVDRIGKNQMENFFYTYVLIILLYMAIMLYGQYVAIGVASEKGSRTMELLITSARPISLMFGKIIGAGLAGLSQMAALIGSGFIFFNLNRPYWQGNEIISSLFDMPLSIMLYCLLFFIAGYFIYAFLYGALGSLASRSEDVNTLVTPLTMVFMVVFFIVIFGMYSGKVDSGLMLFCSFFPLSSPMAMFVRVAMGEVLVWEVVLSVVLLIATTVGLGILSARIYRVGVLLYGKPPRLSEVFKMLRQA
mgnify:CR=1 FL=1|jgi:ABC-2 type transport system permease protein